MHDSAVELMQRVCIPLTQNKEVMKGCPYCSPGEVLCNTIENVSVGVCVSISKICDGKIDCENSADERFCNLGK